MEGEEELFLIYLRISLISRRILACDICGEDLVNMPYKDNMDFDLRSPWPSLPSFLTAPESMSLIRLSWLTSEAPGS